MKLKDLFDKAENGTLTYEQFKAAMDTAKANFVDIAEGGYVSKHKYEDDLKAKDTQITTLNETITKRDTDLNDLKGKLKEAGTDATKLAELSTNFEDLQSRYNADIQSYKDQLASQAYEFAVKEFVGTKKFTSNAAKRDFTQAMINKKLQMGERGILGADDFVKEYSVDNADAFVKDDDDKQQPNPKPTFAGPTSGNNNPQTENEFIKAFNFTGVRPQQQQQQQ